MVYTISMPSILIKDIPPHLHERLRKAAVRDHRSLSKEVIALLEATLAERPAELPPPIELAFPLTQDWLERAIAEGRE
jgi:plasmid stability protein